MKVLSKFWTIIFFVIFFSLDGALHFSYSREISELQCGMSCHANKSILQNKMKYHSECTQCHSSDTTIHTIAVVNKDSRTRSILKQSAKTDYKNMVMIPAGEFIMGSNERWDDESPEFIAQTSTFWIDIFEVTNTEYKNFADLTDYSSPALWDDNKVPKGLEEHPVTYVSWNDASAFCRWTEKRLPTEGEWEKAARGTLGYAFPWGNEFDSSNSNNPQSESKGTKPVGSYEKGKSPYGLYDMSGNVWEWTSTWYMPHPSNKIPSTKYGKTNRVIKGGSWFDCLAYGCGISALAYNRGAVVPTTRNNTIGFRCVKDLKD